MLYVYVYACICVYLSVFVCILHTMYVWTALCVAGRHMGRLRKPAREEAPSCSLALPLPSLRAVVWHLWHLWQLCGTDGTNGNCVASQMAMSCRVCVCRDSCVLARALARRPPSFAQFWVSQVLFYFADCTNYTIQRQGQFSRCSCTASNPLVNHKRCWGTRCSGSCHFFERCEQ